MKSLKILEIYLLQGFWQITARIFGHNLKTNYNPLKGEDRMIEYIIGRIET